MAMIYFRGCTARQKETSIADATEKLLKLANVDYKVLDDEKCCGSVLLRTGFIDEAKNQIKKNTEDLSFMRVTLKNGKIFKERWRHMYEEENGMKLEDIHWEY